MCTNGRKQRGDPTHLQGNVTWQPGNDFYFSEKWTDVINMIEYIKNIITDFPVEIMAAQTSPAADHLFTVRDKVPTKPLREEHARAFYHTTAQLHFRRARAQHNIQLGTALSMTRVRCPDEDDWGKDKMLLKYLSCTLNKPLILSADCPTLVRRWVDVVSMITKEQPALQECVGGNAKRHSRTQDRPAELGTELWTALSGDRPVKEGSCPWTVGSEPRVPIKMVDECPGVYRLLRLLGKTLEVVWERVFIRTSQF